MVIYPNAVNINNQVYEINRINFLVSQVGKQTKLPDCYRNYTDFNYPLVDNIVQYREKAIPAVLNLLSRAQDERTIAEGIYILDRMQDAGVQGIDKSYPVLARFNNTASPVIQTLLSGVYRKTQVPDAFGPLCKMLIRNSLKPDYPYFDPTEEIGGAILDYLRNKTAARQYQI